MTGKLFVIASLAGALWAQPALPDGNATVDQMKEQYIKVWRTLMAPKNVADAFGKRIAKRYIAIQITIANRNSDYQWLIQDASIDLSKLVAHLEQPGCAATLNRLLSALKSPYVTSADLTVLRGVAEKGLVLDSRNLGLRILTGLGTIAGALTGSAAFGPSFAPGVAAFNGPLLSAYQSMFPDFTIDQLNRLNDSAFTANTVVGKQQARVIVIFLPVEYLLTRDQAKKYYGNAEAVFDCADLRLLEASAEGNFITAVLPAAAPVLAPGALTPGTLAPGSTQTVSVKGSNFVPEDMQAVLEPPDDIKIGPLQYVSNSELRIELTVGPAAAEGPREFRVSSKGGLSNPPSMFIVKK